MSPQVLPKEHGCLTGDSVIVRGVEDVSEAPLAQVCLEVGSNGRTVVVGITMTIPWRE